MNCPRCQSLVADPGALFCNVCGLSLRATATTEPPAAPGPDDARCAVHPDLAATDICTRCGVFACDGCVRKDSEGRTLCERCFTLAGASRWDVPWERRAELGRLLAFWQTVKATVVDPQKAFDGLQPSNGRLWDPLSFAIFAGYFAMLGTVAVYAIAGAGVATLFAASGSNADTSLSMIVGIGLGLVALFLVGTPLLTLARVFILGGVEHLVLGLFGANTQGFEATLRGHCYAMGPSMLGLLPICGTQVGELWSLVLRVLAYKGVQKTDTGRAAAAVLGPIGLCCGLYFFGVMAVGALR